MSLPPPPQHGLASRGSPPALSIWRGKKKNNKKNTSGFSFPHIGIMMAASLKMWVSRNAEGERMRCPFFFFFYPPLPSHALFPYSSQSRSLHKHKGEGESMKICQTWLSPPGKNQRSHRLPPHVQSRLCKNKGGAL